MNFLVQKEWQWFQGKELRDETVMCNLSNVQNTTAKTKRCLSCRKAVGETVAASDSTCGFRVPPSDEFTIRTWAAQAPERGNSYYWCTLVVSLLISPAQISFSNLIHFTPALRLIFLLNHHSGAPTLLNHPKLLSPIFPTLYFLDDSVISMYHLYYYFLNID